jgi:hypothetical protein
MCKKNVMKTLTLTAIVAGIITLPLLLLKRKEAEAETVSEENNGYGTSDDSPDWDV